MKRLLSLLAIGFLGSAAAAQAVGSTLPPVELENFTQTDARSYDDLVGRAVLLEFFAHWCGPCSAQVPHLNELRQEYGGKGLSILGVTAEEQEVTEAWAKKHRPAYGYAYDPKRALSRHFGIRGIPYAVLVDPAGTVVWRGHPGSLDEATIEAALAGAFAEPVTAWSKDAQGVVDALRARRFAQALQAAEALPQGEERDSILATLRRQITDRAAAIRRAFKEGDFLTARNLARSARTEFAGLPEGDEAKAMLERIESDPATLALVSAQERIAALRQEAGGRMTRTRAEEILEEAGDVAKEHPRTVVGKMAEELVEQLTRALDR